MSVGFAVGLNAWVKRMKAGTVLQRLLLGSVPFAAVAAANVANVFLMRGSECFNVSSSTNSSCSSNSSSNNNNSRKEQRQKHQQQEQHRTAALILFVKVYCLLQCIEDKLVYHIYIMH